MKTIPIGISNYRKLRENNDNGILKITNLDRLKITNFGK